MGQVVRIYSSKSSKEIEDQINDCIKAGGEVTSITDLGSLNSQPRLAVIYNCPTGTKLP